MLLKGASVKGIHEKVEELKQDKFKGSLDFKNATRIQSHIRFRASKGWVFSVDDKGVVKLVGYEKEPQKVSFALPKDGAEEKKEEKKAA